MILYRPVSSDLYEFSTSGAMRRDPHVYLYVYIQWNSHVAQHLFSSELGWHDLPPTVIRVPFLNACAIHAPTDSPSVFYRTYVSLQYFHMYYRHFGVLLYREILPAAPWQLTWRSPVFSIYSIIIHSGIWSNCASCIYRLDHTLNF